MYYIYVSILVEYVECAALPIRCFSYIYFDFWFIATHQRRRTNKKRVFNCSVAYRMFSPILGAQKCWKNQKQKIKNKWCMLVLLCTHVCVCISVCLYYLCAPACQFGIKLWENEISTVCCQLKQLETGPKARLHRLSPLFAHLAATCCTVGHHRWPTPLLLSLLMICRIACTHIPNSKSVFANDSNLNLLIKHTLCHTHTLR